jgi:acetoin utilization deacetylase AcuC-like enzyme
MNDPLGRLSLSKECHIKRDQFIIEMALKHKIPIIMVLSGGYQKSNA